MSVDVRVAVARYMDQRRARGYKLVDEGVLLAVFADGVHARGARRVTVSDAVAFATRGADVVSRTTQARRLGVIRGFVEWLRAVDLTAADPIPPGLIRGGYERKTPYLYSLDQVEQLMNAAEQMPTRFVADAMGVLIGLLYVTGLRSGEAFALDVADFDPSRLVLCVHGKLDRHRLVPVHPSTAERLEAHCAGRTSGPLLVGPGGRRIAPTTVQAAFRRLVATCELAPQPGTRPPRMRGGTPAPATRRGPVSTTTTGTRSAAPTAPDTSTTSATPATTGPASSKSADQPRRPATSGHAGRAGEVKGFATAPLDLLRSSGGRRAAGGYDDAQVLSSEAAPTTRRSSTSSV
jgi:integrase